jgi:hypothetical protein
MADAPTLIVTNDGDGAAVTASVTGSGTITLYYRKSTATAWTAGSSRTGDGDIAQAGLDSALYEFVAVADDSGLSLPSAPQFLNVESSDALLTPTVGALLVMSNLRDLVADSATFQAWVGAASAAEARRHVRYFGVDQPSEWADLTAYSLGDVVSTESKELIFQCTAAGTSGATEPTWPTEADDAVTDGSAVWTARTVYGTPDNTAIRLARPFAAVGLDEALELNQRGYMGYMVTGSLVVMFQAEVPAAYRSSFGNAGLWFLNKIGAIQREMQQGDRTILDAQSIDLRDFYRVRQPQQTTEGDYFEAVMSVSVGGAI